MLYLISPAKTLDLDSRIPARVAARATEPAFLPRAAELIGVLAQRSAAEVAALMSLSDDLAALNVARYAAWQPRHDTATARPAVLTFDGDVYGGLDARSLSLPQLRWAQDHLVILSGLYGALRPLDLIQPHRLEMGTRLATRAGRDLYAFWGDTVAEHLNARLAGERSPTIVNLASQEYFKVADRAALRARVVDCVFEERAGDGWKVVSFFAKRARGLMARWAIAHRPRGLAALQGFAEEGYVYDEAASSRERLVFRRG